MSNNENLSHKADLDTDMEAVTTEECSETQSLPENIPFNVGLSLRSNFSWTLVGNITYSACQWGMLVSLAKLGTPEVVGIFALALAITAPVIMLANLNLRAVQATDAKRDHKFGDYLGLRIITATLALFAMVGVVSALGYRADIALVILTVGIAKILESISDIFYGLLQQHERMDRIAVSMFLKGPLSLAVLTIVFYLTRSILWGCIGIAAIWALVLALYDIRCGKNMLRELGQLGGLDAKIRPRWNTKILSQLARLALPLGIVMMLITLTLSIPRYFVERFLGARDLGIFAAMSYLLMAGTTVVSALGQSSTPRLSRYYAIGDRKAFYKLLLKLVGVGTIAGVTGVILAVSAGRWILTALYRPEYAENLDVFILIVAGAGVGYVGSFLGYGITATRAFSHQTVPFLILTVITALSSWFLIPNFGLMGAAWATCIINIGIAIVPIIILIRLNRGNTHVYE